MRFRCLLAWACIQVFVSAQVKEPPAPRPVGFALERILPLPVQVSDSGVTVDSVNQVIVIEPGFFVFTAVVKAANAGFLDTRQGLFSWKAGALKTVTLDVKNFKVLHGDPLPEKTHLDISRSRIMAGGGKLHFTLATGFIAYSPEDIQWAGGLYTWDGERIHKVLVQGDSITVGGAPQKVKSVNLQALAPDGGYLVYLHTGGRNGGLVHLKDGKVTPLATQLAWNPDPPNPLGAGIEKVYPGQDSGMSLLCLLRPKKGSDFVAHVSQKSVERVLASDDSDPTDSGSKVYCIKNALGLGSGRALLHIGIYKGGKVDSKRSKLLCWEQGRFTLIHESETEGRMGWKEEANEETILGWWSLPGKQMQFCYYLRRRVDKDTAGYGFCYFDGYKSHYPTMTRQFPLARMDVRPVPGEASAWLLSGRYGRATELYALPPNRFSYLLMLSTPDRLQDDPELVSTNGIRFRLSETEGGDGNSKRFLILRSDGFYFSRPAAAQP